MSFAADRVFQGRQDRLKAKPKLKYNRWTARLMSCVVLRICSIRRCRGPVLSSPGDEIGLLLRRQPQGRSKDRGNPAGVDAGVTPQQIGESPVPSHGKSSSLY